MDRSRVLILDALSSDHSWRQRQVIRHGGPVRDETCHWANGYRAYLVFVLTKYGHRRFEVLWPFAYLFSTRSGRFDSVDIARERPEFLLHLLGERYDGCLEVLPIVWAPSRSPLFDLLTCRQRFEQRLEVLLLLCDEA